MLQDLKVREVTPPQVKEFAPNVKLHRGFSNYLFKMALVSNERTQAADKYEQITKVLEEIYSYKKLLKDYTDYSLFVTGHSLGGALAQIFAFTLAGSELGKRIIPKKPVTAFTYASPECGGIPYMDAFNKLEKEGQLRHLRFSNQGDCVPILVSRLRPFISKRGQPGINIHVYPDKKADVGYNQMIMFFYNLFNTSNVLTKHSPGDYKDNLLEHNPDILAKSVEELYAQYVFN